LHEDKLNLKLFYFSVHNGVTPEIVLPVERILPEYEMVVQKMML